MLSPIAMKDIFVANTNQFFNRRSKMTDKERSAIKLTKWAVESRNDSPYAAPEVAGFMALSGTCDHPTLENQKKRIITSAIVKINKRLVTTKSGSVYQLYGKAMDAHSQWCKSKGIRCIGPDPLTELKEYWSNKRG